MDDRNRESLIEGIREKIERYTLSYAWLIARLDYWGVKTSRPELSNILHRKRTGPKVDKILDLSAKILEEYERKWPYECVHPGKASASESVEPDRCTQNTAVFQRRCASRAI